MFTTPVPAPQFTILTYFFLFKVIFKLIIAYLIFFDFLNTSIVNLGISKNHQIFVGFALVCLFDLILYVPVNNFSVMSGWVFPCRTNFKQG